MKKNNHGGAAQPKHGDAYTPLCRNSGFNKTMSAMESRTRSRHAGTGKHNRWEGCGGKDQGGNVRGWQPE